MTTNFEEPIVPIRPAVPEVAKPPRSFLETSSMLLLVRKPETYLRSLAGLAANLTLALCSPMYFMWKAGVIGGNWEGITGPEVVLGLAPTVAGVVRQWLSRAPDEVQSGKVRDTILGK